ncbi:hypothetical protein [Lacimicrobium sp. SS2-24]|uniref:hypothetical protein n=1 Tax=Lacimicrobium sp. SS2-24 TaxID=2005569 RepID=UPI000B4B3263|nr:hypothetical protein [Lacimicrobium sp. SS2-24]
MLEHGEFRVEIKGVVLHTWPVGSFNRPGLLRYQRGVLDACQPLSRWVLFEHPQNVAAVTNDAMQALGETYQLASENGCIAIACEVGPLFKDTINKSFQPILSIPLLASDDAEELDAFVQRHL